MGRLYTIAPPRTAKVQQFRFAVVPTMTRLDLIVSECKNYGIDCGYGTGTSESAIISSSDASSRFCSFFFRQTEISEVRKYF